MTVGAIPRIAGPTPGNGVATNFPFAFKTFLATDLLVQLTVVATGVITTLVKDAVNGYTVFLNADQNSNPGGSVTYNPSGVPMPAGQTLTITSAMPETQGTHLINGGNFNAMNVEDIGDRGMMATQDLKVKTDSALQFPAVDGPLTTTLPAAAQRALNFLSFDASGNITVSSGLASAPVSAAMAPVVAAATLAAGRYAFGFPAVLNNGYYLVGDGNVVLSLPPSARDDKIINGQIVESHSGNAVTYTLKGKGGVDLSSTNPCYLLFPSATLTSCDFDIVKLTANISVTVSSGSTLGHASAIAQHTFIYALREASGGTAELFVSNLPPDYPGTFAGVRLIATTAEGGGGAADSATGIYSSTPRGGVSWIPVAKVKGTQTVAGTWATGPTQIDMAPFALASQAFHAHRNGVVQSINNVTQTKISFGTETFDFDGSYDGVTNYRHQPNIAGLYRYETLHAWDITQDQVSLVAYVWKNGAPAVQSVKTTSGAGGTQSSSVAILLLMNGTSDYAEAYCYQDQGGAQNLNGSSINCFFSGRRV